MLNSTFSELSNDNPLPLFKLLQQYDSKLVAQQVMEHSEDGRSFFINFIGKIPTVEQKIEFLELCESYGYNIKQNSTELKENTTRPYSSNHFKTPNMTNYPDIICALELSRSDKFSAYLLSKIDKEELLKLESDGWELLPYAYINKWPTCVSLLTDSGLDSKKTFFSVEPILAIAQRDATMLNLYWEMEKKSQAPSEVEEMAFKEDLNVINSKIKGILSQNSKYEVGQVVSYLKKRLPVLTEKQQEHIILRLMSSKDKSLLTEGIELLGKTYQTYEPKHYPLWLGLSTLTNHNILVDILKKNFPLDSYHEETGSSYVYELFKSVKNLNISLNGGFSNQVRDAKIAKLLPEELKKDFWLQPSKSGTGTNFLQLTLQIKKSPYKIEGVWDIIDLAPSWLKNSLSLTQEQTLEVQDILNKTWLQRTPKGQFAVELIEEHDRYVLITNQKSFFSETLLELEKTCPFINHEIKEELLSNLLNNPKVEKIVPASNQSSKTLVMNLFNNMKEDQNIVWSNVKLNNPDEIKDTDLGYELLALQFQDKLQNSLGEKSSGIKKKKI